MDLSLVLQIVAIILLLFCSAYFSGSETAMMKLNPYRLKHRMLEGHRGARMANKLLRKTDRLLTVILIGNNLVNICASVIAANVFLTLFGELGNVLVVPCLTLIVLIFAEVAPKTIAAARPETIAYPSTYILDPLQRILSPVVSMVNFASHLVVDPFVRNVEESSDALSLDELRTIVTRDSNIDIKRQAMLLGILDLGKAKVNNIMIPYRDVTGIDLTKPIDEIFQDILRAQHTRLPVFEEDLNKVKGVLHLKRSARFLKSGNFELSSLLEEMEQPYFVPSGTPLSTQLINFQQNKARIALVVDEYGTVLGIVTLEDILEEIVGEFTTNIESSIADVYPQNDGTWIINGRTLLRELNDHLNWDLPTNGPRTINGLFLEQLEGIPDGKTSIRIRTRRATYVFQSLQVRENVVRNILVRKEEPEPQELDLELEDEEDREERE